MQTPDTRHSTSAAASPVAPGSDASRRSFLGVSGAMMAAAVSVPTILTASRAFGQATTAAATGPGVSRGKPIRIGVIGCGGRGTGAAINAMQASPDTSIVAIADVFPERVAECAAAVEKNGKGQGTVPASAQFSGFDAYQKLLATDCDMVILATPPGFRPQHFAAAVDAGKHIFFEKPVGVDPTGIRTVLAASGRATNGRQCVVTGTQRRHERCYLEAMAKLRDGAIGRPVAARVYWNQGGLWHKVPDPKLSEMENQVRNWLYHTWLSGDHIVEQHVHNIDVMNWAMDGHPLRCVATGGRQARTQPEFGAVFDHFAVDFEFADERFGASMARQQDGTDGRVEEIIYGSEGSLLLRSGGAEARGRHPWKFSGANPNPYVVEHVDLQEAVRGNAPYINEGRRIAESTMTAIMGRMAAYTGKDLEWDAALADKMDLVPAVLKPGPGVRATVPIPGQGA